MTAGRCFTIYDPDAGMPIEDESLRKRFLRKRDEDVSRIHERIEEVPCGEERTVSWVCWDRRARMLEKEAAPRIQAFLENWRARVCRLDGIVFGLLLACFLTVTLWGGYWNGFSLQLPYVEAIMSNPWGKWSLAGFPAALALYIHFRVRRWAEGKATRKILAGIKEKETHENYIRAFTKNTFWWRSIFRRKPAGWGRRNLGPAGEGGIRCQWVRAETQ